MKVISVPLSLDAMHRLDIDESLPGDLEELSLTEETFRELSNTGLFDKLNSELGKIIDEYEDESIQDQGDLAVSLKILEDISNKTYIEELSKISNLIKIAIDKKTGIFFYF
ncbi:MULTISPECIES: hypothetical protein [unclassified Pseudomonas]|uniref:hypothetical protein n=1 Tax=unclassified Pseudomonas TaxID=196821 RepID=UPI000A1E4FCC|nr:MULTISPECIES: hypothetical protein [unclassified Pseudomonas]